MFARFVVTEKVPVVAPAATVTLDGTIATVVLLLESWTVIPVGRGSTAKGDSSGGWVAPHDLRWIQL